MCRLPKKSAKHHCRENCPKNPQNIMVRKTAQKRLIPGIAFSSIFLDLPRSFLDLPRSFPRSSSIFLDLPRSSSISLDLPRSSSISSIFLDLPRSSSIFLDLPRSSSIIPQSSWVLKSAQQIRYRWLQHPQSAFQHPQSACLVGI